jgi:hypothetical protein
MVLEVVDELMVLGWYGWRVWRWIYGLVLADTSYVYESYTLMSCPLGISHILRNHLFNNIL